MSERRSVVAMLVLERHHPMGIGLDSNVVILKCWAVGTVSAPAR
jgi:hypothetical protein